MKVYLAVILFAGIITEHYVCAMIDTDKDSEKASAFEKDSDAYRESNSDSQSVGGKAPDPNAPVDKVSDIIVTSDRSKCSCCPVPCCCKCAQRVSSDEIEVETTTEIPTTTTPFVIECNNTLDVLFILDSSASIGKDDWETAKTFVIKVIEQFAIGKKDTRVALINYSTNVTIEWDFTSQTSYDKTYLIKKVRSLVQMSSLTNTVGALEAAATKVFNKDRKAVPNVAIVVTDGKPNWRVDEMPSVSKLLKKESPVIAIGVTGFVNESQLEMMASGGNKYHVDEFDKLADILSSLVKTVCDEVPTRPPPTTKPPKIVTESTIQEQCICCCPQPHTYIYGGTGGSCSG